MYVYMCLRVMYVCIYVCMYVYSCLPVDVCMYIRMYVHTHLHNWCILSVSVYVPIIMS